MCEGHGVDSSTFSVVLLELLKLVKYAKCHDPAKLRRFVCVTLVNRLNGDQVATCGTIQNISICLFVCFTLPF